MKDIKEYQACYYKDDPTWKYCWGTQDSCGKGYELASNVTEKNCINVCYCKDDGNNCGIWAKKKWDGYSELKDSKGNNITKESDCKKPSSGGSNSSGGGSGCGYHYYTNSASCKVTFYTQVNGSCPENYNCQVSYIPGAPSSIKNCNCSKGVAASSFSSARNSYKSVAEAEAACRSKVATYCSDNGYTAGVYNYGCNAVRDWQAAAVYAVY